VHEAMRKAMKTSVTSNWRPFSRAYFAFIIGIVAFWVMPANSPAQLYVTQTFGLIPAL
jgi:hypothetical protein